MSKWLSTQSQQHPQFQPFFKDFEELSDKKYPKLTRLYHQLTVRLEQFVALPESKPLLLGLYEHFIKDFKDKLNRISLCSFLITTSKQLEPSKALLFLQPFTEQFKNAPDATVLLLSQTCTLHLLLNDLQSCKELLKQSEGTLNTLESTDPIIHASFYKVSAEYYKAIQRYPQYYHNALLFLSSVSLDDLSIQEKQERAYELCMAALLAQGLYNFGELLLHPILDCLENTPYAWLRQLLLLYNSGDMNGFEQITKMGEFLKQPLLVSNLAFLRQKLCLMTLMEVVFKRSKEERGRMTFDQVAADTRVSVDQVEHLVMKALSLGLIKGKIDEVDQIVIVEWVQPRVLDKNQIKHISDRIRDWGLRVNERVLALEKEDAFQTIFAQ